MLKIENLGFSHPQSGKIQVNIMRLAGRFSKRIAYNPGDSPTPRNKSIKKLDY
jgi:hypothetical protein